MREQFEETKATARMTDLFRRVARVECVTIVVLMLAAASLYGIAELADEVAEGETRRFDERLLLALRTTGDPADPLGPQWLEEAARDVTALGSTAVLTLVVLAVTGFLMMMRKRHAAVAVLVAASTGALISLTMKWVYGRPRPDLVPHGAEVLSSSFPSGHALMAAVVYLTLGAMLARAYTGRGVKAYVLAVAIILTVLVGFTRIYLGVHWPTDVLAGWALGSLWALMCWLMMLWLQSRGRVEHDAVPNTTVG